MLRRNLLAVALARVDDLAHGESPNVRSAELSKLLGNRSLVNVSLSGLHLDRFDFSGWQIQRVQGHDGVFSYCENLWRADHDDSVGSAEVDGCSFDPPSTVKVDLAVGAQRLRRLVKPLRRKNGGPVVAIMRRDEILDRPAWDLLGRLRLAQASGKAAAARWTLNADGIRILTSFSMADGLGAEELETLLDVDQDVRALVAHLSR